MANISMDPHPTNYLRQNIVFSYPEMIRVSFSLFLCLSGFCYFTLFLIFIKIVLLLLLFYLFIFMKMFFFFHVPGCSGMFHVPDFIDGHLPIHPRLRQTWMNPHLIWGSCLYLTRFVNVLSVSFFKYVWVDNTRNSSKCRRMKTGPQMIEEPDNCEGLYMNYVCERPAASTISKYQFYMIQFY